MSGYDYWLTAPSVGGLTEEGNCGELTGSAGVVRASPHVQAQAILAECGPLVDELEDAGAGVEVLPLDSCAATAGFYGSIPVP